MIQIPLGPREMKVMYNINNGSPTEFWVPALNQNMRWAAYSVSPIAFFTPYPRNPESHVPTQPPPRGVV
jgi:hypothetical protein